MPLFVGSAAHTVRIPVTAFGVADMRLAVFADVGVMILAVLNAIRCLFVKNL